MEMPNPFENIYILLESLHRKIDLLNERLSALMKGWITKSRTVDVLSQYLDLAPQTIYGLTSRKKIPFKKGYRRIYFLKAEIDEWLYGSKIFKASKISAKWTYAG